mgnify:CR=1 FL=1
MSQFWNRPTTCLSKHQHPSKLEATYCNRLLAMVQAKEIQQYRAAVEYPLRGLNSQQVAVHVVDFEVVLLDGRVEVHEVKGKSGNTPLWRLKRKLFEDNYPSVAYVVITRRG